MAIGSEQAQQLVAYLGLIAKWNKVHNLTAVRDADKMLSHHILDSLSVQPYVGLLGLLDVGSGAGLPGIPLAIANPGQQVSVMDSNQKKTSFLRQAVMELGLKNVTVITGRVESLPAGQRYQGVISRAFAELEQFVTLTRAALAPGGRWFAMKGAYPGVELEHLPSGVGLASVEQLSVPTLDAQRHLVILKESHG